MYFIDITGEKGGREPLFFIVSIYATIKTILMIKAKFL